MILGVCRLRLELPDNDSLKGKRNVVRSICAKVRQRFNVAIAEVEDQDAWQWAGLGFAVLSSDAKHVDRMVQEVLDFIEAHADAPLGDYQVERLYAF
jgi:uncharacterized protein YlxP (DUF503 family)